MPQFCLFADMVSFSLPVHGIIGQAELKFEKFAYNDQRVNLF